MQVLVNTSNNTELHNHHGHNPDDDFDIYLPAKNVVAEQLYELDKMPRTIDDAVDLKRTNGPQGGRFDLGDPSQLATVKTGWMRGGFDEDGLWPEPADPREILRRVIRRQAEADYESIIDGSAASKVTGDPS